MKSSVIVLSLIFILIASIITRWTVTATPKTIRVPTDYPTIQQAINAASSGDTIYVYNGTYYERIKVTKTLTLIGQNPATTKIDGKGLGLIVNVTADYVTIKNFTIQNGRYYTAIWVENPLGTSIIGATITKNIFLTNYICVQLCRSLGAVITDNTMTGNQYGINTVLSKLTTITNNVINNCLFNVIYMYAHSDNNTIKFNKCTGNKYGIHIETSDNNEIRLNDITSSVDKSGYGIRLTTATGTKIVGNTIKFNYYGIVLWNSAVNNMIYYNNFMNNTLQQYHSNTAYTANTWDTNINPGAKGNYWSDYKGLDNGIGVGRWGEPHVAGDGVGDTLVPHQNVDYYPLMHPWSPWPVARFTHTPQQPYVNETVTFDASESSGDITSYKWNFGDLSPEVNESDPITTHAYQKVGNYTVTLTVATRDGFTNSTSQTITVLPYRLILDVYTQKEPYSGKGYNATSDAFAPQDLVILYGLVTLNDDPVPDKLVRFDVYDPNGILVTSRSNTTDENGIAVVDFRLENNATFGTYLVIGSVEVTGNIATDYLRFEVGWIINIVGLETVDMDGMPKIEFRKGETVYVNIFLRNIAFTSRNVTLTIVLYDEKNEPIAVASFQTRVDSGWVELKTAFALSIPDWSLVGVATVHANAFTKWMLQHGVPYCPEREAYMNIQS
jgi:parallel beta-helix repeat protein